MIASKTIYRPVFMTRSTVYLLLLEQSNQRARLSEQMLLGI